MPRKTTGSATTRSKKAAAAPEPVAQQPAPVAKAQENVHDKNVEKTVAAPIAINKSGVNGGFANTVSANNYSASHASPTIVAKTNGSNANGSTLDEEIRHRAYQLYLERNGANGDENSDWFVAEREVRARHATAGR